MSSKGIDISGSINDLRKQCKNHVPVILTKKLHKKLIKGYTDQPIGLMELLWWRGYIDPSLEDYILPNNKCCREIVKNIP